MPRLLRWILRSHYVNVNNIAIEAEGERIPMGIHFELENTNRASREMWAKAMTESYGKSMLAFHGSGFESFHSILRVLLK
jgi:hypothetical protein